MRKKDVRKSKSNTSETTRNKKVSTKRRKKKTDNKASMTIDLLDHLEYNAKLIWLENGLYRGETQIITTSTGETKEVRHGLGIMIYAKKNELDEHHRVYEGFWFKD